MIKFWLAKAFVDILPYIILFVIVVILYIINLINKGDKE